MVVSRARGARREARKLGQVHELKASGKLLINYEIYYFFLTVLFHETLIEGRIKGKLSKGKLLGKESL